ncbi:uncharacterized protein LOC143024296 [Oratosquilla oratoria]|uniref:uncharacterized protein LOC143024296 n=1 Tax=Oratosquilla oratoria TaxID=337810 RepID=UPI003F7669A5
MQSLVFVSVVLGVAIAAPQGFPLDTPENNAARLAFIREYNRLAKLAADAPDIHIYMNDPRPILKELVPQVTFTPAAQPNIPNPTVNNYQFSADLGRNSLFQPGPNTFPAGHLAGHLAGHQAPAPQPAPRVTSRFAPTEAPVAKWTGPVADTVPAGLEGLTKETPAVAAARAAHIQNLANAYSTV